MLVLKIRRIGRSKYTDFKPTHLDWRKYFDILVDNYKGQEKRAMKGRVNTLIRTHYRKTDDKINKSLLFM